MNSNNYKEGICKYHGNTKFIIVKSSNGRRCILCRTKAVQKRRDKVKGMAVEYKGGKCQICGYNKCVAAMDFHHPNPNEKDFSISHKGYTRAWKKVKEELDKCILLCANCHREEHFKLDKKV